MIDRVVFVSIVAVGLHSLIGCNPKGPELGVVSGTVTLDGRPATSVKVYFQPAKGRPSVGLTDAEGKFTVQYSMRADGALLGKSEVYMEPVPREDLRDNMPPPTRIPRKYLTPFQTVEIESGRNHFDFELVTQ